MTSPTALAGPRHACVIGAGIVGAATAHALAERGWRVTLVDAHAQPGRGESLGNGAQLSYSYVEPLATPDALKNLPKWLLLPDSPLRWRPQPRFSHARWLSEFVAACQWPTVRRTSEQLLSLAEESRRTLHRWLAALPGSAEATRHTQTGKLVIYRKPEALADVQRQIEWQRAWGCAQAIVGADEVRRLEPALAATGGGPIAFGVWTATEEVIDAARLAVLLAQASGATLRLGRPVQRLVRDAAGRVVAAELAGGERIEADAIVMAAGPATVQLLAAGRTAAHRADQGLQRLIADRGRRRRAAREHHRQRPKARPCPAGRPAARGGLCRADRHEPRAAASAHRGAVPVGAGDLPRRLQLRRSAALDRPAAGHAERPAAGGRHPLARAVGQRRPWRAGPYPVLRQRQPAGRFDGGPRAGGGSDSVPGDGLSAVLRRPARRAGSAPGCTGEIRRGGRG
nr:FAD-dependent oxidoreductase [Aquincola sp. J276]